MLQRLRPVGATARLSTLDRAVLLLGGLLLLVLAVPAPPELATVVVVAGGSVVPGWAVARHLPVGSGWGRAGLTVALSLALLTATTLGLAWSQAWHPRAAGAALVLLALLGVVLLPVRPGAVAAVPALPRVPPGVLLAGAAAAVLWLEACLRTRTDALGPWGLLGALPLTWYLALAVVLAGLGAVLARPVLQAGPALLWTGLLTLLLHGTAPLVHDVPRYVYVYKHLGVTRYVLERGTVDPGIDIYHRWPGLFTTGAWVAETGGLGDPTRFAAWAELYFGALGVLLVLGLALALAGDARRAWTATAFFLGANWIGQNYYAPQALALVLMLAVLLVVAVHLQAPGNRLATRLSALGDAVLRARPAPPQGAARQASPAHPVALPVAVVLVLFVPLVASHQLTPYVLAGVLAALAACGLVRPWWLPAVLLGVCVAYLVPNADYVSSQYGIISSLNPWDNVSTTVTSYGSPSPAKALQQRASVATILGVWLVAAVAVLVQARRRGSRAVLPLALLAFLPVLTVAVQSYGGEGRLRVYLYSLPFCSLLVAGLLDRPGGGRGPGRYAPAGVLVLLVGLLLLPYFGRDDTNGVQPDEVASSEWVYANAPAGDVLLQAVPGWPSRYGPDYGTYSGPVSEATPNLLLGTSYEQRSLQPADEADVAAAVEVLEDYGDRGVLIFTDNMADFARANRLFGRDGLQSLERAVAASPSFRLVFENSGARVYRLQAA